MLVHAAGESSPGNLPDGTFAIVLSVPDEATLARQAVRLLAADVPFHAIREPDGGYNNALMAIGVVPGRRSVLRRHFANLPLLKFCAGSSVLEHSKTGTCNREVGGSIPSPRAMST